MEMQENVLSEETQLESEEKNDEVTKAANVSKPVETRIAGWTSLKEFSVECGITYEAVRQQVQKHSAVLEGHIKTIGKTRYLDSYAKKFLRGKKVNAKETTDLNSTAIAANITSSNVEALPKKSQESSNKLVSDSNSITTASSSSYKTTNSNSVQLAEKIDEQNNEIAELKKKIRSLEDDIKQIEYDNILSQSVIASMNVREFKNWKEKFKSQMRDTMDI